MINLNNAAIEKLLFLSKQAAPNEICGFILENGQVYPCENIAKNPKETFQISLKQWQFAEDNLGDIVAIYHSHPNGLPYLSSLDRQMQLATELPWLLVVDNQVYQFACIPPLLGRVFKYGNADCMACLRDAFSLCGINLPNPKRGDFDTDMISNRFILEGVQHGFTAVRLADILAGDICLFSIGGEANHVGLYLGNGQFLHHAANALSKRDELLGYWQHKLHSVWRHQDFKPDYIQAVFNDFELEHK